MVKKNKLQEAFITIHYLSYSVNVKYIGIVFSGKMKKTRNIFIQPIFFTNYDKFEIKIYKKIIL